MRGLPARVASLRVRVLVAVAAVALAVPCSAVAQDRPPKPAPAPVPAPPVAPAAPLGPRPEGADLVVLDDGAIVAGKPAVVDEDVVVATPSGGAQRSPAARVSIAVAGGRVVHRGEETGLWRAWKAHVGPAPRLPEPAPVPQPAPPSPPAPPPRGTAPAPPPAPVPSAADVEKARAAWLENLLRAADACAALKARSAASALLAEAIDAGLWGEETQRRAIEWEPLEFPFSPEDEVRSKLVAEWARALVPLGGRFILRDDPTAKSERSALWTEDSIAIRTRNLVVFSLDREVGVVGSLLRQGEATVRNLEALFGKPHSADDPMEIRLYVDRKQYLTESDGISGLAPMWSGGFFSPAEQVSRFYVSRAPKTGTFLEGELHEVLSHELTHHWIETRFCAGAEFDGAEDRHAPGATERESRSRHDQPGHWIVEGVARFVEDQAILWKKNGARFDDARSECVLSAAGAHRTGLLIPLPRYVDITPKEFQFLSDIPRRGVRATKEDPYFNTERGVFYDQGGTLAFFMMNRRGEEGRKLFVRYLKDVYGGRMTGESWKRLGFASSSDLETAFTAFLATVR